MENFREFQGKDLDDCIEQSCVYYNCPREKLEIEILQDAKSGIFGIVGARKAKIRARRAHLPESMQILADSVTPDSQPFEDEKNHHSNPQKGRHGKSGPAWEKGNRKFGQESKNHTAKKDFSARSGEYKTNHSQDKHPENTEESFKSHFNRREERHPKPEHQQGENFSEISFEEHEATDDFQFKPLEELDANKIEDLARGVVNELINPVAGKKVNYSLDLSHGYVHIKVDWEGDAGLIIGRDGQTLAAIQYIASRIISRGMNAALRVQVDIGDYRRRREDKLCELAKSLAEKARQNGRPFTTRPLSAYHRRIVHLCLQDEPDIITRSSGDGPLKKVLIAPRRHSEQS